MSWDHTVLIVVPSAMVSDANQLSLALGTDPADVETFGVVWYSNDGVNQTHSVCCTRSRAGFIEVGQTKTLPAETQPGADLTAAQRALDALVIYDGTNVDLTKPMAAVDVDPHATLKAWGLSVLSESV